MVDGGGAQDLRQGRGSGHVGKGQTKVNTRGGCGAELVMTALGRWYARSWWLLMVMGRTMLKLLWELKFRRVWLVEARKTWPRCTGQEVDFGGVLSPSTPEFQGHTQGMKWS